MPRSSARMKMMLGLAGFAEGAFAACKAASGNNRPTRIISNVFFILVSCSFINHIPCHPLTAAWDYSPCHGVEYPHFLGPCPSYRSAPSVSLRPPGSYPPHSSFLQCHCPCCRALHSAISTDLNARLRYDQPLS